MHTLQARVSQQIYSHTIMEYMLSSWKPFGHARFQRKLLYARLASCGGSRP